MEIALDILEETVYEGISGLVTCRLDGFWTVLCQFFQRSQSVLRHFSVSSLSVLRQIIKSSLTVLCKFFISSLSVLR